jgi:hypothetical protein
VLVAIHAREETKEKGNKVKFYYLLLI